MNDPEKLIWSQLEREYSNWHLFNPKMLPFFNEILINMWFFYRSTNDPASLSKSLLRARLCTKSCVSVNTCENGDTVLIVFNEVLSRFIIAQVSFLTSFRFLKFFLH